jgi:hypothetical protein
MTFGGAGGGGAGTGANSTIIACGGSSIGGRDVQFSASAMASAWTPSTTARLAL